MIGSTFGLVSAQRGLLGLLGIWPLDREYPDWGSYVLQMLVFAVAFLMGLFQWRVWRGQDRAYSMWIRSRKS